MSHFRMSHFFVVMSLQMILEEKEKKIEYTYRRRVCTFVRLDLPLVRSYWWTSTPHYRLLHSSNTLLHFYYSLILRKRNNPICIFVTIYLSSGRFFAGRKYIFFYFIKRLILALFKQIKKIIRKIYLSLIC